MDKKIQKVDDNLEEVTSLKVEVVNQPKNEEIKNYIDAPEYYENKISKEEIEEIETE